MLYDKSLQEGLVSTSPEARRSLSWNSRKAQTKPNGPLEIPSDSLLSLLVPKNCRHRCNLRESTMRVAVLEPAKTAPVQQQPCQSYAGSKCTPATTQRIDDIPPIWFIPRTCCVEIVDRKSWLTRVSIAQALDESLADLAASIRPYAKA